jgi:hypothetical protein
MNTLSIFAGLDHDGVLRFVGDVTRGAACGCRCAACGAALIAKRGDQKVWHFAHEASQERPDCLAGAVNLLRRLAIEQLRDEPALRLPAYRKVVSTRLPLPKLSESIEVNAQPIGSDQWNISPVRGAAAARLMLDTGDSAALFVEVRARQTVALSLQPGTAAVLVEIPLPLDGSGLQDLAAAKAYLEDSRQIFWRQHPAGEALASSTLKRLSERAQALDRDRAFLAGWARSQDHGQRAAPPGDQPEAVAIAPSETDNPQWVAWRKPKSSFHLLCKSRR